MAYAALLAASCAACSSPHAGHRRDAPELVLEDAPPARADLVLPIGAQVQEPDPDAGYRSEFYSKNGVYVSARYHGSWLAGGDFDGDTALVGPDTILVPEADDGDGYEIALGWMNDGFAGELSYTEVDYDGSIGASEADVEYYAIALQGLYYVRANAPLQPYFLFGMFFPWADLEDASTDGVVVGDGELENGFGLDLGLGLSWWLSHRIALDVRGVTAYQWFDKAEGVAGDSDTIDDPVEAWSFGLSVGLTWVLGKPGGGRT